MMTTAELDVQIEEATKTLAELKGQRDLASIREVKQHLEIVWSLDRSCFYITDKCNRSHCWMSVEKLTDEPAAGNALLGPGHVRIRNKRTGVTYYRKTWNFSTWSIKSQKEHQKVAWPAYDDLSDEADMINDYIVYSLTEYNWKGWE
jgi:hypothetical protein